MDKFTFNRLVENPALVQPEQVKALQKIVEQYPYCQPAKILLTKAAHLAGHLNYDKFLNQASAGMLDRNKLKQWIHSSTQTTQHPPQTLEVEITSPKEAPTSIPFQVIEEPPVVSEKTPALQDQNDLLKNLEESLAALRHARNKAAGIEEEQGLVSIPQVNIFETVESYERLSPPPSEETKYKQEKEEAPLTPSKRDKKALPQGLIDDFLKTEHPKEPIKEPFSPIQNSDSSEFFDYSGYQDIQKDNARSRTKDQEKIDEIAKDFPMDTTSGTIESSQSGDAVVNSNEADFLLSYLEQNKRKRRLKNISKDKVDSILNKFIQEEPTIKPAHKITVAPSEEDLSMPSSRMEQLPASENFAQLLILQGKYSKAIEVFEELILKFPEKKPYFVSRIEDLKNNLYS